MTNKAITGGRWALRAALPLTLLAASCATPGPMNLTLDGFNPSVFTRGAVFLAPTVNGTGFRSLDNAGEFVEAALRRAMKDGTILAPSALTQRLGKGGAPSELKALVEGYAAGTPDFGKVRALSAALGQGYLVLSQVRDYRVKKETESRTEWEMGEGGEWSPRSRTVRKTRSFLEGRLTIVDLSKGRAVFDAAHSVTDESALSFYEGGILSRVAASFFPELYPPAPSGTAGLAGALFGEIAERIR